MVLKLIFHTSLHARIQYISYLYLMQIHYLVMTLCQALISPYFCSYLIPFSCSFHVKSRGFRVKLSSFDSSLCLNCVCLHFRRNLRVSMEKRTSRVNSRKIRGSRKSRASRTAEQRKTGPHTDVRQECTAVHPGQKGPKRHCWRTASRAPHARPCVVARPCRPPAACSFRVSSCFYSVFFRCIFGGSLSSASCRAFLGQNQSQVQDSQIRMILIVIWGFKHLDFTFFIQC